MSKKQKQRTKGNVRPSSSGRAAELLAREGGGHVGFVGFGSMSGDLGYVPTSVGFEDQDAALDTDFRMVLRKLSKRDIITKLKAIQEFQGLCGEKEEEAVISMLPHWPRVYNRLSMDHDKRVREATQQMFLRVVQRVKRNLAPHLKAIMGCWLMSQNDPYAPAGSAARAAFTAAFTGKEKQGNAVAFCKAEVLQLYKDNLFKETEQTLSDPKSYSKDEQVEKYLRVVSSSLLALREFVSVIPQAQHQDSEEELITILSEDRMWKFAKHKSPLVRGAMYSLLGTLCRDLPSVLTPYLPKLSPALLGCIDESDPETGGPLWEAVLRLVSSHEDAWKHVNLKKAFLPKLWSVLRHRGNGLATTIYPSLLPLLSHLPAEVIGQGVKFYQDFFDNFREGCNCKHICNSGDENRVVLKSFMECLRYCLAQNLSEEENAKEIQTHLVNLQLVPLLKTSLTEEAKGWSVVTIYQQTAALLSYLYKQQASSEKGSLAASVLESLWASISELCVSHVTSHDADQEEALARIGLLVAVLKNPESPEAQNSVVGKRKEGRVSFPEDEEKASSAKKPEEGKPESISQEENIVEPVKHDSGRSISSIRHPQLTALVSCLTKSSSRQARETSLPHLRFLAQLVRTFPTKATIQSMLDCRSGNASHIQHSESAGEDCRTSGSVRTHKSGDFSTSDTTQDNPNGADVNESSEHDTQSTTGEPAALSSTVTQSGEREERSQNDESVTRKEDNANDDHQLPLKCIYSLLLPWLLDVERSRDSERGERHVRMDAIVDMIIALGTTLPADNQALVTDAVTLKAQTAEVVHLLITKMKEKPELASGIDAWLRSDLFGEKLLAIQNDLCRVTLRGGQEETSVGWKLVTLALSCGDDEEPLIGTAYAELLLVGFYQALTRPDVVATATQCISFICDITINFFTAVKGCVLLSSSADLLLALFQLECREASHLSGVLKEKVHNTWVQGVQTLVKQTGALLSEHGLLMKIIHWIKQSTGDKEGNIHQNELMGGITASYVAAILNVLPSNSDGSQDVLQALLESLLPSRVEWLDRRQELANQWMTSVVIGQQMTVSDLPPLTLADRTTPPPALSTAIFIGALVKQLAGGTKKVSLDGQSGEEESCEAVSSSSQLPWECDVLQSAILELLYVLEWCNATVGVNSDSTEPSAQIISPPGYCLQSAQLLSVAMETIWKSLNPMHWQELFGKVLDRSLMSGGLWARCLDHFIDSNDSLSDKDGRLNVWLTCAKLEKQWYDIHSLQMLQTLERLVPHFNESCRQDLAETHIAMLMSAEDEEMITSICGAMGHLTVVMQCASHGLQRDLPDIALSGLRQLQQWRERLDTLFIFSGEELEGASSRLVFANTKMIQLLTLLVEKVPEHMESHDWDFILCSLVSWIQACCENISQVVTSIPAASLCAATSDLLSATASLLSQSEPSVKLPDSLPTEWSEFFSDGAYSVFLPAFMQFVEDEASWTKTGADLTPLLYSLCEGASHAPCEQLKGHRLPLRLQPGCSRHVPDTMHSLLNQLAPLLASQHRPVQMAAYSMLERVMPEFAKYDEEYLQVKNKSQVDDEDEAPSISPPTGLQRMLDSSTAVMEAILHDVPVGEWTLVQPGSEAFTQTRSYILAWRLYLAIFRAASMEVRAQYSAYLKQTKGIHNLLDHLFSLMPPDPSLPGQVRSTTPSKGLQVTMFSKQPALSPKAILGSVNEVQHLACSVYYSLLKHVPAIARLWWNQQDRRIAPYVDKFTTKFVSPLLCAAEIRSVQESPSRAENMTVKALLTTREVIATYSMQDLTIELTVTLPANHPLGPIQVDNRKKVAVGTSQWRQWTLMLTTFLTHQNGSIMEGLNLWRSNADKRFEGIEDCMICFSVIHGGNCSLPKLTCKTCKKRFHSACLYKWFSTSTQSSCPLCRSPF